MGIKSVLHACIVIVVVLGQSYLFSRYFENTMFNCLLADSGGLDDSAVADRNVALVPKPSDSDSGVRISVPADRGKPMICQKSNVFSVIDIP